MNDALAAEGSGGLVHVEHRSFKARGSSQVPTRHQGPTRTSIHNKQARQLRAAWERANRQQQLDRHGVELAALKSRHERHGKENQQMRLDVTARAAFDRAAMVEERRQEAREIARKR
jgi:hypothetical protein